MSLDSLWTHLRHSMHMIELRPTPFLQTLASDSLTDLWPVNKCFTYLLHGCSPEYLIWPLLTWHHMTFVLPAFTSVSQLCSMFRLILFSSVFSVFFNSEKWVLGPLIYKINCSKPFDWHRNSFGIKLWLIFKWNNSVNAHTTDPMNLTRIRIYKSGHDENFFSGIHPGLLFNLFYLMGQNLTWD